MSRILDEVLSANDAYADSFGARATLALPPARGFAILTCMDARLDPAKYAGLSEGDAHVIRNAGGRASDDAIRSLVISYKLLGTREWFVIHHTDCGMEFFSNDLMSDLCGQSLETAELGPAGFTDVGSGGAAQASRGSARRPGIGRAGICLRAGAAMLQHRLRLRRERGRTRSAGAAEQTFV